MKHPRPEIIESQDESLRDCVLQINFFAFLFPLRPNLFPFLFSLSFFALALHGAGTQEVLLFLLLRSSDSLTCSFNELDFLLYFGLAEGRIRNLGYPCHIFASAGVLL